jgi:hypothetical protein
LLLLWFFPPRSPPLHFSLLFSLDCFLIPCLLLSSSSPFLFSLPHSCPFSLLSPFLFSLPLPSSGHD